MSGDAAATNLQHALSDPLVNLASFDSLGAHNFAHYSRASKNGKYAVVVVERRRAADEDDATPEVLRCEVSYEFGFFSPPFFLSIVFE